MFCLVGVCVFVCLISERVMLHLYVCGFICGVVYGLVLKNVYRNLCFSLLFMYSTSYCVCIICRTYTIFTPTPSFLSCDKTSRRTGTPQSHERFLCATPTRSALTSTSTPPPNPAPTSALPFPPTPTPPISPLPPPPLAQPCMATSAPRAPAPRTLQRSSRIPLNRIATFSPYL